MIKIIRQSFPAWHTYLRIAIVSTIFGIALFKAEHPYPFLTHDSYYYITAAVSGAKINTWPIGYSKFLEGFSLISRSPNLLVLFQYLLLNLASLYFFFTWVALFRPSRLLLNIVFVILFINPLFLYIANYVLSDALFISLSIFWFTQLLWIVFRPAPYMVFTNALILAIAFTIRYNALYYPLIGALGWLLSRQRVIRKVAGIFLPLILVGGFIIYTSKEVGKITGEPQFSPYGNWKLANDALYGYAHVSASDRAAIPSQFKGLDSMVSLFQTSHPPFDLLEEDSASGSYFMFKSSSPLIRYMDRQYGEGPFINSKKWMAIAPFYKEYGLYLIRTYPWAFGLHFVWPNFQRYCIPSAEILASPNAFYAYEPIDEPHAMQLFKYEPAEPVTGPIEEKENVLIPYPFLFPLIHLCFVLGWLGFLYYKGYKEIPATQWYCILLIGCLWIVDLCFNVLSSGVVMRYQIFLFLPELATAVYLLQYVYLKLDRTAYAIDTGINKF